MNVLIQDYASTGITWVLAGTDHVINADWFNKIIPGSSYDRAMKAALRKGGAADLNIYTVG
jgi:hypothetical protein